MNVVLDSLFPLYEIVPSLSKHANEVLRETVIKHGGEDSVECPFGFFIRDINHVESFHLIQYKVVDHSDHSTVLNLHNLRIVNDAIGPFVEHVIIRLSVVRFGEFHFDPLVVIAVRLPTGLSANDTEGVQRTRTRERLGTFFRRQ